MEDLLKKKERVEKNQREISQRGMIDTSVIFLAAKKHTNTMVKHKKTMKQPMVFVILW